MSRILAVDWGERRVGVAISDATGLLARALPTIETRSERQTVRSLLEVARREEAEEVVVGLPLHMDGTRGEAATSAETLARRLHAQSGLPVHLWDERLTSVEAERLAREAGEKIRGRKGRVDARAAEVLLQSFLDARAQGRRAADGE